LDILVVTVLNGIVYGLLLFMIAAGLTVVFGMMGVLNFAHTAFYMIGAYVGFVMNQVLGFWAGLIVAPIVVGLLALLVEKYLLRKVHAFGHAQELLLTFGLAFVLTEIVKLLFGPFPVSYRMPDELRFIAFHIGDIAYPFARVFIALVSAAMFVAIYLVIHFTRLGLIVRAASENASITSTLGHNVPYVFSGLFAFAGALAGLGGAVGGAVYSTSPQMASELAIIVFIVVVIGGLGSLIGAFVGAIALGLATSFSISTGATFGDLLTSISIAVPDVPPFSIPLSATAGVMPYLVMLAVLLYPKRRG
jgi:branched-chain amino acid transport system permease protein